MSAIAEAPTAPAHVDAIEYVPLAQVKPAADNPRKHVGDVAELAASILAIGLLEPLVVMRNGGTHYKLVCGARRLAAAKLAALDVVPIIVRDFTETERQEAMLIENLQRTDLTVLEEAEAYQRLVALGHSQRDLAGRVGRSQAHVSKRLALLELPMDVRKKVDSGGISLDEAGLLLKLREHPTRLKNALADHGRYHGAIERCVRTELRELELEELVAKETAAIKAEGIPLLQMASNGPYYATPPKGTAIVSPNAWDGGVHMSPAKHAKLDCHAAAADPRSGKRVYLCRDPGKHNSAAAKRDATAEKRKAHERELRAATRARREFIAGLLVKPPGAKDELVDVIVRTLVREAWQSKRKLACEILGLEAAEESDDVYYDRWGVALDREIETRGGAVRVGLAIHLAVVEEALGKAWDGWKRHQAHFDYLASHGYTPAPSELLELAGKAPR